MERKIYQPTAGQEKQWNREAAKNVQMPTDDEFKARWAKAHHGKERGWGIGKRDWILGNMTRTREYQMGIWQGRVDAVRGLPYSEDRNENTYNLGYHRGYLDFDSNYHGFDANTRQRIDSYRD